MFDPLSNFKLNKIKKGVDSVKAAVDALPTSLSSSFTDVKNAISNVKEDTSSSKATLETLTSTINKEYLLNMDIRQVSAVEASSGSLVSVTGSGVLLFVGWDSSRADKFTVTIDNKTINYTENDAEMEFLLVSSQYFSFIPTIPTFNRTADMLKLWEGENINFSRLPSCTVYSPVAIPFNSKLSISHDVYASGDLLAVYALY